MSDPSFRKRRGGAWAGTLKGRRVGKLLYRSCLGSLLLRLLYLLSGIVGKRRMTWVLQGR